MAYVIRYDHYQKKEFAGVRVRRRISKRVVRAGIAVVLVLMTWLLWNTEEFRSVVIPGDADVTQAAWSGFVEDVRNGVSMIDAVTTFCKGILYGKTSNLTGT